MLSTIPWPGLSFAKTLIYNIPLFCALDLNLDLPQSTWLHSIFKHRHYYYLPCVINQKFQPDLLDFEITYHIFKIYVLRKERDLNMLNDHLAEKLLQLEKVRTGIKRQWLQKKENPRTLVKQYCFISGLIPTYNHDQWLLLVHHSSKHYTLLPK